MLEMTISGAYKTSTNEMVDFDNVKGVIPFCGEEHAKMHAIGRYAARWIKEVKKADGEPMYPKRVDLIPEIHVDDIQETVGELSFAGKDIRELSYEELQDLATCKDLREIPLYKVGSLRSQREKAYLVYAQYILHKTELSKPDSNFNLMKAPKIVVNSSDRVDDTPKETLDDIVAREEAERVAKAEADEKAKAVAEAEANKVDTTDMTIEDLMFLADEQNIIYDEDISFDELKEMVHLG